MRGVLSEDSPHFYYNAYQNIMYFYKTDICRTFAKQLI